MKDQIAKEVLPPCIRIEMYAVSCGGGYHGILLAQKLRPEILAILFSLPSARMRFQIFNGVRSRSGPNVSNRTKPLEIST
jgi:hypothetical protein